MVRIGASGFGVYYNFSRIQGAQGYFVMTFRVAHLWGGLCLFRPVGTVYWSRDTFCADKWMGKARQ